MGLVVLSAFLTHKNAVDLRQSTEEVERLNRLISTNERLLSSLKDLETGQRGYLLTGNQEYLAPFRRAALDVPAELAGLQTQMREPEQLKRVQELARLIAGKRGEVEASIVIRDRSGPDAALALVKTDRGRITMDAIRELCASISRDAQLALASDSHELAVRQSRSAWMGVAITFALFLFLVLAATVIRYGVRQLDGARQQLKTTLLSIGDGVVATDAQGRVVLLNSAACQISGWSERDAVGKPADAVLPLIGESSKEIIDHPVHRVLREKTVVNVANQILLKRPDGTHVPVDDSAAPIFSREDQNLAGVVMVIRDVSARHQADLAIRKWEHVFEHAGFGMAVLGLGEQPVLEQSNAAFARMHGYSPDELPGRPLATVVAPDAWETELRELRDAERTGRLMVETAHRRKDGSHFPALADVTVVRDDNGKILYGTAYYSDITERIRAEEELRKNEARFRTLADSLPQLVWTTLPDGTLDYFNNRWEEELGIKLNAASGGGFHAFLYPADRERCTAEWQKAIAEGRIFQAECRLRGPKSTRWYICRSIPVRGADGRIERWFGSCTDVDEQKKATEALRTSKDELQRSNLDLEQFAFAASHDLQEPLRMVAVYAQLLREEYGPVLEGNGKMYLTFAVDGARRMELLLKALLAYSRAASPGASVPPGGIRVLDAINQAIGNLAVQVEESHATIEMGELPLLDVPEVHVVEIFQNLLSNAIKYHRTGVNPLITISARRQDDDWLFTVHDNGIGIDPKFHSHIFRVFRRLHGADYPGTGIGLALCQRLIERSGGRIWVDSTPGAGSTFSFTLPVRQA
jgi:PAS domain S-box-containing protein